MNIQDLNRDDQMLVQTQFPQELEKEAADEAGLVNELYATGFDKLASGTIEAIEKGAMEVEVKEDEEDDGKKEKKDEAYKEKMDEGEKKEASARGAFIARGYIDGLMEKGAQVSGDPMYFIYDLLAEKVASAPEGVMNQDAKNRAVDFLSALKTAGIREKLTRAVTGNIAGLKGGKMKGMKHLTGKERMSEVGSAAREAGSRAKKHTMRRYDDAGEKARQAITGNISGMPKMKGMKHLSKKERALAGLGAVGKVAPEAAGVAGLGYMAAKD